MHTMLIGYVCALIYARNCQYQNLIQKDTKNGLMYGFWIREKFDGKYLITCRHYFSQVCCIHSLYFFTPVL